MNTATLLIFCTSLCILSSCAIESEKEIAGQDLAERTSSDLGINTTGYLNHLIFFELKEDLTAVQRTTFLSELMKLEEITQVKNLNIGQTADLGDKRAIPGIDCTMYMQFETQEAFDIYNNHPDHLAIRSTLGKYLQSAPGSTDFYTEN